jgi:UDP-N-acetylmuramoylalanine--D-glutamate ligase
VRPPLPDGPYLIVGLARSGAAAARMLLPYGPVLAADTAHPDVPDGVEAHLGSEGAELLERVACVVKSPGVPNEAPVIAAARAHGIPVHGELELAWRLLPNRFIAVTGTNGKTTTTELLGAVHREAGVAAAVAGNVGTPLASLVGAVAPEAVVVCEVSSFQAEDSDAFAPETALLLNLAEDHLDRHGTFAAYRDAKLRVFRNQRAEHAAVAPAELRVPGAGRRVVFGAGEGADLALREGTLRWRGEEVIAARDIRLRGAHNLENAMGAAAAALAGGLPATAVAAALRGFAGVPHRLEEVAWVDGVLYVNDSKATNVASAVRGIEAFGGGVHAILGGSLKGGGFEGLTEAVRSSCRACYLIGEAADRLESDLQDTVPLHRCGRLEAALEAASAAARPSEVVLLSPAAASFDQYRDYEQRGERFKALVAALASPAAAPGLSRE